MDFLFCRIVGLSAHSLFVIVPEWAGFPFFLGLNVVVKGLGATPPDPAQYGPTGLSVGLKAHYRAYRPSLGLRPALFGPAGQMNWIT